jgi:hypothetical protein
MEPTLAQGIACFVRQLPPDPPDVTVLCGTWGRALGPPSQRSGPRSSSRCYGGTDFACTWLAQTKLSEESGKPEESEVWTRSQSIRTACQLPLVVNLLETTPAPAYQRIAFQVRHLRRLGPATL